MGTNQNSSSELGLCPKSDPNQETVMVILGPNHQTIPTGFEAQTEKPVPVALRPNH
jgi:hypothetical protein